MCVRYYVIHVHTSLRAYVTHVHTSLRAYVLHVNTSVMLMYCMYTRFARVCGCAYVLHVHTRFARVCVCVLVYARSYIYPNNRVGISAFAKSRAKTNGAMH